MIKRKRFSVVNRNDTEKNSIAIEKCIKRYEKKTGRFCSKNGRYAGNNFFRWDCYVLTCSNHDELKKLAETQYGPDYSEDDYK